MKHCVYIVFLVTSMIYTARVQASNKNVYFSILAGGSGERLWPLSRAQKPKQLLSLNSEQTLLEQAITRIEPLACDQNHIWVITSEKHQQRIAECVQDRVGTLVVEPAARNTGPAILYTCLQLAQKDPDAIVVFLPADPFIPREENRAFAEYLARAISFVQTHDAIALLGVEPTYPATGYGYIEFERSVCDAATHLHKVAHFHEKPSLQRAQEYIGMGNTLWNIGMFCGKVSVFLHAFKTHCPELFNDVNLAFENPHLYAHVQSISVDHAVIEHFQNVWVLPVDFTWFDVGNVGIYLTLQDATQDKIVSVNAKNNLISVPNKLVALVGVDDLCVIQTEDALLITKRDEAENVKKVVKQLKDDQWIDYL